MAPSAPVIFSRRWVSIAAHRSAGADVGSVAFDKIAPQPKSTRPK